MSTSKRLHKFLSLIVVASLLAFTPVLHAQFGGGGFGGGGGGFGGGGQGGGGFGGGGQGGGQNGAGVVINPQGVLKVQHFDIRLTQKRIQQARQVLDPNVARQSELRKVSLTRLEAEIARRLEAGEGVSDDMRYLAGLTSIDYVFFYPETGDIVVAGPAEGYAVDPSGRPVGVASGRAVLELQDLIVALRSFGPAGDKANTVGVSIDPTREGLQRMQQFMVQAAPSLNPRTTKQFVSGLQKSLGQQVVSVEGISPKTHFAQVLVEADYRMKLIGIGLEKPPVAIRSYIGSASPSSVNRNAMARWYFTPNYECVRISDDNLAMQLVGDGVKLVGADELVQADGSRVGSGVVDRASKTFQQSFTEKYPQLASQVPVYAQMRNLIDMLIVAAFIQEKDYYSQASWDLGLLGNEEVLSVEVYPEPKTVETAVNAVWKGNSLMTPIGGGVDIQPLTALASPNLLQDEGNVVRKTHERTTIEGLQAGQWWWD